MKKIFLLSLCLLSLLSLPGCHIQTKEPLTKTGFFFDTVIQITLYDHKEKDLIDQCFSYCREFEKTVSKTIDTSDVSKINRAEGKPVVVTDDTVALLKKAIHFSQETNGAFDVTIAPLTQLWDFKSETNVLPSENSIETAKASVGYQNILIEDHVVTLKDPNASIDLGGIAKGYMADKLKSFLIEKGVNSAVINLGGNILTIGKKPDGKPFQIGIKKPFDASGASLFTVSVTDQSVVTSGCYERYFILDDTIYHHILDPKTGYPVTNNLYSVTILSDSSTDGDALSTACFVLGLEDATKWITSLEDVDAIFVTNDYQIIDTRKQG